MNEFVRVLLGEKEPETISVLSLSLAAIPECKLHVSDSADDVLIQMESFQPDLILLSQNLPGRPIVEVIPAIHRYNPAVYVIVSLSTKDPDAVNQYVVAGANDCITKDQNYVPRLMSSVKRAFIRISERQAFKVPAMSRADLFAMDENLPDVIFSLDRDGRIIYVNRAVSALLGYEQKDILHKNFTDLIVSPEIREQFSRYLAKVDSEINFRKMIALRDSLGIEENFEINFTLMEGEVVYGVARKEMLKVSSAILQSLSEAELDDASLSLEPESIPARLGPYKIVTLLGAGGMGRVYQGFDEQLERNVAIKVVSQNYAATDDYQEKFHREARNLASICHPNIALIYYYGTSDDLSFFCMEYLPGGSLEDLLSQKGVLEPEEAISFAIQVAMGLKEAFAKGIVHLDIKPSNLMLAEDNRIKIVDFGLARKNWELDGPARWIIGTPLYVAPEQLTGTIDYRCDIYSLGITLFQMVYGSVPFTGSTTAEVFSRKLHEDFPNPQNLNPKVSRQLYELITRMGSRDPSRRIGDYSELIAELENVRRSLKEPEPIVESQEPAAGNVLMRGNLYDRPFAEVLGEIAYRKLSGKLTLSWIDLYKTLHFREGRIIAVLSSQEGENFIDLVLSVAPGLRKKLPDHSSDLFQGYSTAMAHLSIDSRERLSTELKQLAERIMESLFSWYFGEYLFEEGKFQGQMGLELQSEQALEHGIRKLMDPIHSRRKMFGGKCRILQAEGFREHMIHLNLKPSDCFLLFRFETSISYPELLSISGLAEEEFSRLLYLFYCLGLIRFESPDLSPPALRKQEQGSIPVQKSEPIQVKPVSVPEAKTVSPPDSKTVSTSDAKVPPSPDAKILRPERPAKKEPPPADLSLHYFLCAERSFEGRNFWACVEYCKKALEFKKESRTYHLMGNALATHPRFRHEAMEAYVKAQKLDPANPLLEFDIGEVYYWTGNYALARTRYQNVLKLDPFNERAEQRLIEIRKKKKP